MGRVAAFFLEHRMMVTLMLIALIVLGLISVLSARKESFPEISLNRIVVRTVYPGATARDVEKEVTVLLESELLEVDGIKEILSYSEENVARLEIRGLEDLSALEFEHLLDDVKDAVDRVDDLPIGLQGRPTVKALSTADTPVLELAYTGKYELLKPYLEGLRQRLRRVPGVAGSDLIGVPDSELQILVDARKASQKSIDLRLVADALARRNSSGSGGILHTANEDLKIILGGEFREMSDILNTHIVSNAEGYGVRLHEIAHGESRPEDLKLLVRSNGQPGATLTIRKRGQADLITTVNAVHTLLADEKLPDGVGARILMDQSLLTRGRISLLISNAAMGFGLVLLILMYFLDYKTAIWTAFGIPVTLLGMLIFLKWQNISINLISLAGFIILIGMIVDDAVVIAEEFNTNREHGMLSSEAAIAAVKRMWKPIFASSATTMIAFAPLFIVGGFPGAFIWVIPLMVIVGLLVSLLESFVMLPVHLAHGKHRPSKEKKIIITLERWYVITLTFFLRHRYIVLVALLILLLFSAALFRFAVRKDPFPQDAADAFNIVVTLPPHFTVERSTRELKQIEQMLLRLPAQELLGFSTRQGTQSEDSTNDRGIQGNLAIIMVYLHPFENRTRQATEIMAALEEELATLARQNQMEYGLLLKRLGPPMGRAVEVRVIAADDEERKQRSTEILNFLKGVNGIVHLESDERLGLSESQVVLNERLIAAAELREQDILNSLRIALDGLVVTTIRSADLNTDVRLRLAEDLQSPEQLIQNIPVVNRQGRLLELNRFVSFIESQGAATINHIHGVRTTTIYGDIDPERTSPTAIMAELQAHFPNTPAVRLEYSGQAVETRLIFGGLTMAGLAAVVGIYLMIALIFNSFTRPIVVMASLPFMAIGAAFTLVCHNVPGSMMVGVAIVGLMGVIVNASIVLVDTIQSGTMKIDTDSIINGARSRLRPIFLSTATTVLGVLPTGYGIGGFDPFLSHMSLVLAYGLAAGTFIVLIIVPVLLQISLDLERALARRIQG